MDDEFETERLRIFCARGPGHAELIPELWAYIATIYMHVRVRACMPLFACRVCVRAGVRTAKHFNVRSFIARCSLLDSMCSRPGAHQNASLGMLRVLVAHEREG